MTVLRRFFLAGLLLAQAGCPMTCIVNPFEEDYLTTDTTVTINGELLDYENFELQGVVADTEMPCTTTYYRESYDDYQSEGATSSSCETTSERNGFFTLDLNLPDPGLYRFNFDYPPIASEGRLITVRPDLEPAPDQYVHIDWETESDLIRQSIADVFTRTLDADDSMALIGAEASMIETERIVESYYDDLRVFLTDSPTATTQIMTMKTCEGEIDYDHCNATSTTSRGLCNLDYLNSNPADTPCRLIVPRYTVLLTATLSTYFSDNSTNNFWFSPNEDLSVRVEDVGRLLAWATAHELAHSLGLVSRPHLYGSGQPSPGHNPYEPSFLAVRRFIPMEVVQGDCGGYAGGSYRPRCLIEDCTGTPRSELDPGEPVIRCPHRWNAFNRQYLEIVQ